MDEKIDVKPKRRMWPWIVAGVVLLPLSYPLSHAPASRLAARGFFAETSLPAFTAFYQPFWDAYSKSPAPVRSAYDWYLRLWNL